MPLIDREVAYWKFKQLGFNSSHFVWFLAELDFFETRDGFVFAFKKIGEVTLFALEPLIPDGSPSFPEAWREVLQELSPRISAFVSVYPPFLEQLTSVGFQNIRVGSEPWVKLSEWMPTGNSARGVRSARNFAVKAGLRVEEWSPTDFEGNAPKRTELQAIYKDWAGGRWLSLRGFTLATDPFARMADRRYFIIRGTNRIEGYIIASPVPKTHSYYLEDIILRRDAPKGAGELLTLDSMAALNESGAFEASLGVCPAPLPRSEQNPDIPPLFRFLLVTIPAQLRAFYNFEGMELYRKRFKPYRWVNVYFAVGNHVKTERSDTLAWMKASLALLRAFKPRLSIGPGLVLDTTLKPWKRFPVTTSVFVVSVALFVGLNHGGILPESILTEFGFSGASPFKEWVYRSVVSDFLYSDAFHFYSCFSIFLALLYWAESTQRRIFFLAFFFSSVLFDDFLNYVVVILPFKHFHSSIFATLVSEKQVGGSLVLALFLGLQIVQLRKHRELIFVATSLLVVLGIIFVSGEIHALLLNLNHFFFLSFGFVAGKIKFEWDRNQNRKHAKDKTPVVRHSEAD
jgi:hypothetical protein